MFPTAQNKFRPVKFEVRPEEPQVLEAELSPLLSSGLRALMFNKGADFKKHCQAAEMIVEAIPTMFGEVGGGLDGRIGVTGRMRRSL